MEVFDSQDLLANAVLEGVGRVDLSNYFDPRLIDDLQCPVGR